MNVSVALSLLRCRRSSVLHRNAWAFVAELVGYNCAELEMPVKRDAVEDVISDDIDDLAILK
jgi:hypothetical protein